MPCSVPTALFLDPLDDNGSLIVGAVSSTTGLSLEGCIALSLEQTTARTIFTGTTGEESSSRYCRFQAGSVSIKKAKDGEDAHSPRCHHVVLTSSDIFVFVGRLRGSPWLSTHGTVAYRFPLGRPSVWTGPMQPLLSRHSQASRWWMRSRTGAKGQPLGP